MKKETSPAIIDDIRKEGREKSDFSQVVETLLNDKFKRRKTILTDRQVYLITTLDVIAQVYDIPFLKSWVDYYAEWKTSGMGGQGRKDIVEISKFKYAEQQKLQSEMLGLMRGRS